ncbi:hypothetical protein HETIRDRAFT_439051 [Heterobasidion irregulare TC 32-1]|uniref:Uncharacterized protein n=1 Tax=Heterobasidion irregulare (strain TC 32-1) TaxID=747525 RepID=W4KE98_HETIT|nr:uncharacterized protein HETIRDRAFT_439051 [Heterobasidion irregulare TC 32-1]ETW84177.1 hypothetical protein HETIRDRAFT_439051 [Heterobasidion irregulare TC 32-1]
MNVAALGRYGGHTWPPADCMHRFLCPIIRSAYGASPRQILKILFPWTLLWTLLTDWRRATSLHRPYVSRCTWVQYIEAGKKECTTGRHAERSFWPLWQVTCHCVTYSSLTMWLALTVHKYYR